MRATGTDRIVIGMRDDSALQLSAVRQSRLSRRSFVKLAASGGVALAFGSDRSGRLVASIARRRAPANLQPNQWITIDQNDVVTIRVGKTEMGQGVRTSLPAIIAAELGADWARVRVEQAEPGAGLFRHGDIWQRKCDRLVDGPPYGRGGRALDARRRGRNAVRRLTRRVRSCKWLRRSHREQRATFGSLVVAAAELPVPAKPLLRPANDLPLLGTRLKRIDTPAIVRGQAVYGIDVRVANMKFAVIARPPTAGATARRWNEAAARSVAGVSAVTRVPSGFAVVASNTWAAMEGRQSARRRMGRAGRRRDRELTGI